MRRPRWGCVDLRGIVGNYGNAMETSNPTSQVLREENTSGSLRTDQDRTNQAIPTGLAAAEVDVREDLHEPAETSSPSQAPRHGLAEIEFPESLQQAITSRLELWVKLMRLEQRRIEMLEQCPTAELHAEIARQNAQLRNIPYRQKLLQALKTVRRKRDQVAATLTQQAPSPVEANSPINPSLKELHLTLLDLAIEQIEILLVRSDFRDVVVEAAQPLCEDEPLCQIGDLHGIDGASLVAWTYYAAAVEQEVRRYQALVDEHDARMAELVESRKHASLIDKLLTTTQDVPPLDPEILTRKQAAENELNSIETFLNDLFWALYEKMAWLFASGELEPSEQIPVRAFLRYGLVSSHAGLIAGDKRDFILQDCAVNRYVWHNTPNATHVVYADEYIEAVHHRNTTPGPDEQLELNNRGSDLWKADRLWRWSIFSEKLIELYQERRVALVRQIEQLGQQCAALETEFQDLKYVSSRQSEAESANRRLLELYPHFARLRRILEQFEGKLIPRLRELTNDGSDKIDEICRILTPQKIIRREVQFIRRLARLAGRLKTPFPQFVLRDIFDPHHAGYHHRQAVLDAVRIHEETDQFAFHQVLIPNKVRDRRLTMRIPPTIILVPGCGIMSVAVNPRQSNDAGKIMIPLLCRYPDQLPKMITHAMADFVWDCSMEQAGKDWITADALCAAYANVRWEYRHHHAETQRKSGFHRKNNDRQDWRGHYELFVSSIKDGGRRLLAKCPDVYEVVLKFIGLPPGIERCHRRN